MNHDHIGTARAIGKATMPQPNLKTKTEQIAFRLNENTLAQIDGYCTALNMNRNNVIELMLHVFLRYVALTKLERRSKP
jgi:hypothetical protein